MKNIAFICLIVGALLTVFGFHEFQIADGAEITPTKVSLSAIEANGYLDKKHITIEEHWKAYPYLIYKFKGVIGQEEAEDFNEILYSYYPVVSASHPFVKELELLSKKHGGQDKIPDQLWPDLSGFSMLVKTKKFQRISEFPENVVKGNSLRGIIMNGYSQLSEDERKLITEGFPSLNINQIKLLDQGRQPIPSDHIMILIGAGGALLLLSIGLFLTLIYRFIKNLIS